MKATSQAKNSRTLRPGSITTTNKMGMLRRMPDMTGNCPLVLADLSDERGMPDLRIETSVSLDAIHATEQAVYLFKLQIGGTLVCWLADPNDPEIHDLLQAWTSANYMFVALKTRKGVMVRNRSVCGALPSIEDIHAASGGMDTARFMRSATEIGHSAFIKSRVQSDIASVQKIWKVRVFQILGKAAQAAVSNGQFSLAA